ncbi:ParB/RepB/Spo0J family partition protein [Massilia sp. DD77]|uniref:ParB/RepB/Spo0J family partition protein n=1 Tax=Massilia sp. DD77 TaxID=3109349 RepID=UPI002FFE347C
MRALTKLNQGGSVGGRAEGTLPEMPLAKIVRDPENPRPPLNLRTLDEQKRQAELNANVQQRGVKSPISLRPHPTLADMWVINYGHCRYDAAEAAGFATIPYFIDPNFDSYDQVAENLHRSDLSIWAIAAFIKRKLDEGHSKSHIAERLGKEGQNYVTEHLALIDAPNCVHQAYASGVRSPRTLYDLRRAYDEFPEHVEEWCNGGGQVTRDTIREELGKLRHDVAGASAASDVGSSLQEFGAPPQDASAARDSGQSSRQAKAGPGKPLLCHHVTPAPEIDDRPRSSGVPDGVEASSIVAPSLADTRMLLSPNNCTDMLVFYRGRKARLVCSATVKIIVEGDINPLEVPLTELVFEWANQQRPFASPND